MIESLFSRVGDCPVITFCKPGYKAFCFSTTERLRVTKIDEDDFLRHGGLCISCLLGDAMALTSDDTNCAEPNDQSG